MYQQRVQKEKTEEQPEVSNNTVEPDTSIGNILTDLAKMKADLDNNKTAENAINADTQMS